MFKLDPTPTQMARVARDWSRIAKEPVAVEMGDENTYAHGSELACLRLFYKFRFTPDAQVYFSSNLNRWIFRLPRMGMK